jgi:outer membrane protein TolC
MSRSVFSLYLALALAAAVSVSAEAGGAPPNGSDVYLFESADRLGRTALIQAALQRSPSLEAARHAWEATTERVPQAAALDDPILSYSLAPLSIGDDDARFGQIISFGQRLPYPGKRSLRGEIATAEAEASRFDFEEVRLLLATRASQIFDDYYLVHRAIEINDEHIDLLGDFQRVATARYAAGTASQQDPLQAEVEIAHLLHQRLALDTKRRNLIAQINALIHRRPDLSLPPPPIELPLPEALGLQTSTLEEEALANRPELLRLDAATLADRSRVELEQLDFRPDFLATGVYNSMWNQGDHRWLVGVGITLPLYRKRLRAGVAEAEARLQQTESDRLEVEDEIRSGVQMAIDRLEEAHHVIELYRSRVLPASRDQVSAAVAGFQTGGTSFLALIEAERSQRTAELQYHAALASYYSRRAELERQIGRLPGVNKIFPAVAGETPAGTMEPQGDRR